MYVKTMWGKKTSKRKNAQENSASVNKNRWAILYGWMPQYCAVSFLCILKKM